MEWGVIMVLLAPNPICGEEGSRMLVPVVWYVNPSGAIVSMIVEAISRWQPAMGWEGGGRVAKTVGP